jgi:hypothetical protein
MGRDSLESLRWPEQPGTRSADNCAQNCAPDLDFEHRPVLHAEGSAGVGDYGFRTPQARSHEAEQTTQECDKDEAA